ncbi:bifunctional nuclease family protein [Arabiibacter massiliensis]|uniref:bifunctional nuclease family protein n=1 Tax=Arabiibacter massiliensis TaxID=1870985 RepID=UPI0009B9FCBF|nr:bifunctional nuclease family protein [Arabiibacter massiliensis]
MVPVNIQTLIFSAPPSPSIIVLRPVEEAPQEGKFRIVPIWVGVNEATQMGIALERARFSRPMTHDLFLDALTNLDARVDHVVISDVKGATFFARLSLRQHDRLIDLDARPSDALALAVRQKAPIYIDEGVLERASFPYVLKKPSGGIETEHELSEFRKFLEEIAPEDFEA